MPLLLGADWHSSAVKQIACGVSGYSLLLPCRVWFHWPSNFQVNVERRKVQFPYCETPPIETSSLVLAMFILGV